ncbi:MAG TPA: helix-turn-helix transcriptional regulator [Conexibacter sp.]
MHEQPNPRAREAAAQTTLGRAVRELRARFGLSQEGLAFQCRLHRNYVGAIERGEINAQRHRPRFARLRHVLALASEIAMPDGDALPLPRNVPQPEPQQLALAKPRERRETNRLAEDPAGFAGDLLDRLDREDLNRWLALSLPLRSRASCHRVQVDQPAVDGEVEHHRDDDLVLLACADREAGCPELAQPSVDLVGVDRVDGARIERAHDVSRAAAPTASERLVGTPQHRCVVANGARLQLAVADLGTALGEPVVGDTTEEPGRRALPAAPPPPLRRHRVKSRVPSLRPPAYRMTRRLQD